jgi:hypothetical protein
MGTAQFLALATLNVNASGKRYNADAKSVDWARRTLSRTASLPGVKSVGTSSVMVVSGFATLALVVSSNNPSEWIRSRGAVSGCQKKCETNEFGLVELVGIELLAHSENRQVIDSR